MTLRWSTGGCPPWYRVTGTSLVPGYMTVSWTVSPPAVGVRATCGVDGRPEGERRGRRGRYEQVSMTTCPD